MKGRQKRMCRRLGAALLALLLTVSNVGGSANMAFADVMVPVIRLQSEYLKEAAIEALDSKTPLAEGDYEFINTKGEESQQYARLFDGDVYEISPLYSVAEDKPGADAKFFITDEHLIILFENHGEEDIKFWARLDDNWVNSSIVVAPYEAENFEPVMKTAPAAASPAPKADVTETVKPETPEMSQPEVMESGAAEETSSIPETTQAETTEPETTPAETAEPENTQDQTTESEVTTEPEETTAPTETTEPETTQAEVTEPETQPETEPAEETGTETADNAETAEPETTQADVTEAETEPVETQEPEVTAAETAKSQEAETPQAEEPKAETANTDVTEPEIIPQASISRHEVQMVASSYNEGSSSNADKTDNADKKEPSGKPAGKTGGFEVGSKWELVAVNGEYTAIAYITSFEKLGIDLNAPNENYVTIGDSDTRYSTLIQAVEAAEASEEVLNIHGRVKWGYDTENWPEKLTIQGTGSDSRIMLNGAYASQSGEPHKTYMGCDITFDNLVLETTRDMNYIFANGHKLQVNENVAFEFNGTTDSGEVSSSSVAVVGGSDVEPVAQTNLILNGGKYFFVFGGGFGQDVAGDVEVFIGPEVTGSLEIVGGGFRGNVGGSVKLDVNPSDVTRVIGGSYKGHVEGNTDVYINSRVFLGGVCGGSARGHVTGSTSLILGNESKVSFAPTYGGSVNKTVIGWTGGSNTMYYPQVYDTDDNGIGLDDVYVGGSTYVEFNGTTDQDIYAGGQGPVGSEANPSGTTLIINGTVNAAYGNTGVFGGGSDGDVYGDTNVTIGSNAKIERSYTNGGLWGGTIVGGGNRSKVYGDTHVTLNGKTGSPEYGILVLGGGFTNTSSKTPEVFGTTHITVNAAPYECTGDYAFRSFSSLAGMNSVNGIFGGGFNYAGGESTEILINTDMGAVPVYGGGFLQNSGGDAEITIAGSADNVYNGGKNAGIEAGNIGGSSTVILTGNGTVKNIYGHEINDNDGTLSDSVSGTASVVFDGNGTLEQPNNGLNQIVNMDKVTVTNGSHVNLNNTEDYSQLIHVNDLTVNSGAELRMEANVLLYGSYTGGSTSENGGVLGIRPGKKLIAQGNVSGYTSLDIMETELLAADLHQIYVASMQGSQNGSFVWVDPQKRFDLEQNQNLISADNANLDAAELEELGAEIGEAADKWWLVKASTEAETPEETTPTPEETTPTPEETTPTPEETSPTPEETTKPTPEETTSRPGNNDDDDDDDGPSGGGRPGTRPGGNENGGPGTVVIEPEPVPLADMPPEAVVINEEEVPLAPLPKTGETGSYYGMIMGLSGILLLAFSKLLRKKEEDGQA